MNFQNNTLNELGYGLWCSLIDEIEFVVLLDAEITAGREVPDPHRMQPVDETTGPLGTSELQPPERASLAHHAPAFVDD